ncbi:helix-turn-helix domain containing protein [Amycolatopsis cynarae]|uniref:Helix-turn-helix domain containing protein n=1 Tax=Amycolatopsis cynarae TaxID=2995223 RepID=A0ABY7BAT2_9PSEU|nr:TetR/AcrR family transcriptional regulator [Amycolatopsis sp. HUAS 11-8]WAL68332.1 helix-turn-helix domain containing protein [Amycolatopsis sp. HUAS 11-8]
MSSHVGVEATRRRLTQRQARMVQRLAEAAVAELRAVGYADLTVRNVAARAGVVPATAYTYFSSKNHLVAELFWRRLQKLATARNGDGGPRERVVRVLRDIALLVVDEPWLAAGCTTALLGGEPDVAQLRQRIGGEIRRQLRGALGPGHDPQVLHALEFAFAGSLTHAGMGYVSYREVADRLAITATFIMKGAS